MSTSTPVIYKGRLYVGCSGKGYDWDGDSGSGIAVVDVSGGKLDIIYKASTPGYPRLKPRQARCMCIPLTIRTPAEYT